MRGGNEGRFAVGASFRQYDHRDLKYFVTVFLKFYYFNLIYLRGLENNY